MILNRSDLNQVSLPASIMNVRFRKMAHLGKVINVPHGYESRTFGIFKSLCMSDKNTSRFAGF